MCFDCLEITQGILAQTALLPKAAKHTTLVEHDHGNLFLGHILTRCVRLVYTCRLGRIPGRLRRSVERLAQATNKMGYPTSHAHMHIVRTSQPTMTSPSAARALEVKPHLLTREALCGAYVNNPMRAKLNSASKHTPLVGTTSVTTCALRLCVSFCTESRRARISVDAGFIAATGLDAERT